MKQITTLAGLANFAIVFGVILIIFTALVLWFLGPILLLMTTPTPFRIVLVTGFSLVLWGAGTKLIQIWGGKRR